MWMSKITGVGKYIPSKLVTNKDLETKLNTSDEWIQQRSGIIQRYWITEGETTSGMAHKAALEALKDAGKKASDVDAIVFATITPDYYFPGSGVLLQKMLCPERTIPALDVRNACSGFLYALSIADAWVKSGMYKCVLVVGSEIHSTGLDKSPEGRDVSVLFGDGAGAVVVEPSKPGEGLLVHKLHSEGEYAEKLMVQRPSSNDYPNRLDKDETVTDKSFFPVMDGRFVFKHAVTRMCEVLVEACHSIDVKPKDIDFVLAHQANMRINQMVLEQLGIPQDKTLNTIQKYGNTTAGTLPIGMDEAKRAGLLKPGQLVAMVAFGSGFTWGASLMRV
ncbi:MAG: ketoacyl-ACP synthase III [Oligoflexia bacterium]|nr:ketoacyl-ACP synthase III [Oligoflexia bacterium]